MHIKTDKRENYNERVFREDSEKYFGKDRIYCSDRCFESRKFLPTFRKGLSGCRDAVEIAVCQEFNSKVLCIEDAGFWRIMKEISKHEMCQEFMEDKLNAFIEYDQKNEK